MNKCGDCTECCYVIGVPELNKGNYEKCDHSCNGCTIYKDRPSPCDNFNCTWLLSGWDKQFRPDKVGLVVLTDKEGTKAYETKKGEHLKPKAQSLIKALSKKTKLKIIIL